MVSFRSVLGSRDERLRPGCGPWAYFLTFACYGARLHGSESGSVDREHNVPGTPTLPVHERRVRFERREMTNPATTLNGRAREVALLAIRDVCDFRGWVLHAAHVRSNPVHIVVAASTEPSEGLRARTLLGVFA